VALRCGVTVLAKGDGHYLRTVALQRNATGTLHLSLSG
jgi:hypothetical protein